MRKEGYGVLRAYSGTETLYLLGEKRPDLILKYIGVTFYGTLAFPAMLVLAVMLAGNKAAEVKEDLYRMAVVIVILVTKYRRCKGLRRKLQRSLQTSLWRIPIP